MNEFQYMLAPMEGITSNAFRTLCHRHGADLTFTELVKVGGLARKNKLTWSRLDFKDETPVVAQLLGVSESQFTQFLAMFEPPKGFEGFNLNLGCPSPEVIREGQGCALVRRVAKTKKLLDMFRDHGFKASVKMRLGLNQRDKENKVYLNLISGVDAEFFVVHARHGTQTSAEPADFSVYEECVETGKNIIANGDIHTKKQVEFLKNMGVKGVMIGREAVRDPAIFDRLKKGQAPAREELVGEYLELTEKFAEPEKYRKMILKCGIDKDNSD
ncbi:MAG: tRNA-dihydrouridine synthase family protein [archaeon]